MSNSGFPVLTRYLEARYARDLVDDGKLRLGSLGVYQDMERQGTDAARGDSLEGHMEIAVDRYVRSEPARKHVHQTMAKLGLPGGTIEDCFFSTDVAPLTVLCMSEFTSFRLAKHFKCSAGVRIIKVNRFLELITNQLGNEYEFCGIGRITYVRSRALLLGDPDAALSGGETKPERFFREREVRACWRRRDGMGERHVDVTCPALSQYCILLEFK